MVNPESREYREESPEHFSREDRDLLITMHEQIKNIRADIHELKEGTASKLTDHEARLRRLELWSAIAIGVLYALQFYFNFVK